MKKVFTLLSLIALTTLGFSQVIFESDFSNWTAGSPDGWMGTKSSITLANVTEVTFGATYGTSMVELKETTTSHKRFTTQPVTVVPGNSYEIKMWMAGNQGELRTGYFYNDGSDNYLPYNDYIDVNAATGGNLTLVSQTVNIPAGATTSGEFIISIRSTGSIVGIVIDSVAIVETTPFVAPFVSIYDIQYTTDVSGDSPEAENIVQTAGIVTGVFGFGGSIGRFFIQDGDGPWNGIYVYDNLTAVTLGDSVFVTGKVIEYFGLTEITNVTDVTIVNSGNPQPTPVDVATGSVGEEQYEGVLIRVVDAKCMSMPDGYGQWNVNDNSGNVIIDDNIYEYTTPVLNNVYNITGVNHVEFGDKKIFPRMLSDFEITGFASVLDNENNISIYPNPANNLVYIKGTENSLVNIYDVSGKLVITENILNDNTPISVESLENGMYIVEVIKGDEKLNFKLQKN